MKKIAVLILSAMMLFAVSAISLADSTIFFDYMIGEMEDSSLKSFTLDSDDYLIFGGTYRFENNWSVSGEYVSGKMSSLISLRDLGINTSYAFLTVEDEVTTYKIKGGYAIINNSDLRLDLIAGYSRDSEKVSAEEVDLAEVNIESYLFGTDALLNITDNMTISAGVECGFLGKGTIKDKTKNKKVKKDLDLLLNYHIAFNYYFFKQLSLSLGYRSSSCELEKIEGKTTTFGFTTGVAYKF